VPSPESQEKWLKLASTAEISGVNSFVLSM
jgi:hypothetical protein